MKEESRGFLRLLLPLLLSPPSPSSLPLCLFSLSHSVLLSLPPSPLPGKRKVGGKAVKTIFHILSFITTSRHCPGYPIPS